MLHHFYKACLLCMDLDELEENKPSQYSNYYYSKIVTDLISEIPNYFDIRIWRVVSEICLKIKTGSKTIQQFH